MGIAVLGLDIGGANLKAAHTSGAARTVPFPVWKHPNRLAAQLANLCSSMPRFDRLAVTMTGELCDCFATKQEGVRRIIESVLAVAANHPTPIWTTRGCFVTAQEALADPLPAAAANWLALARYVGPSFPNDSAILIDTGSTTTDIVYIDHGLPRPIGLTDPDRLRSGELVYTGVRRTPICAVLGMKVAAEFFATMLDAYLVLRLLPEAPNDCDTADGRPATIVCAIARLARMRCADAETFSEAEAREVATDAADAQRHAVEHAIERVVAGRSVERVVVSGSGEFLGRMASGGANLSAERNGSDSPGRLSLTGLSERLGPGLSEAACAYAVATLAQAEKSP